jgi:hypothetical protein
MSPNTPQSVESRVARVEALTERLVHDVDDLRLQVMQIRTHDLRWLLGVQLSIGLALAGIMATGFGWV